MNVISLFYATYKIQLFPFLYFLNIAGSIWYFFILRPIIRSVSFSCSAAFEILPFDILSASISNCFSTLSNIASKPPSTREFVEAALCNVGGRLCDRITLSVLRIEARSIQFSSSLIFPASDMSSTDQLRKRKSFLSEVHASCCTSQ